MSCPAPTVGRIAAAALSSSVLVAQPPGRGNGIAAAFNSLQPSPTVIERAGDTMRDRPNERLGVAGRPVRLARLILRLFGAPVGLHADAVPSSVLSAFTFY